MTFEFFICILKCLFILGITSNNSVVELLEKRVKSRFSHRRITLFPSIENRFKDLLLPENLSKENWGDIQEWNKHVSDILEDKNLQKSFKLFADLTNNHNEIGNILVSI